MQAMRALFMIERRSRVRETKQERAIQTRVHLPDGINLGGTVRDLSDSGAKILGDTGGLSVGDEFALAMLLRGGCQVTMECQATHIEPGISFGVRFLQ